VLAITLGVVFYQKEKICVHFTAETKIYRGGNVFVVFQQTQSITSLLSAKTATFNSVKGF